MKRRYLLQALNSLTIYSCAPAFAFMQNHPEWDNGQTFAQTKVNSDRSMPANPPQKPGYQLEFSDDFNSGELDTNKWLPFYLPQWSNRQLAAAQYSLQNNQLHLYINEYQKPWNPKYDGNIRVSSLQTGCFSGAPASHIGQHHFNPHVTVQEAQPNIQLYTPQYGYFEIRLKAVPIPGYMVAFWMIGVEATQAQSAEICICEIFGDQIKNKTSQIGYGVHPFSDANIVNEFYQDDFAIIASEFHIYAAEWTPTRIDFFIDNIKIRTIKQSPNYPMQFMLGIYEIPDRLSEASQPLSWPKIFSIDYVRGYRPLTKYSQAT